MPPAGDRHRCQRRAAGQVREEARCRDVELVALPTAQAIGMLAEAPADTNAILHLTC